MADLTVKGKLGYFHNFGARVAKYLNPGLVGFALLSFIASLGGALPARVVEDWYARGVFPKVSYLFGLASDLVPFSWLDIVSLAAIFFVIWAVRRRRFRLILGVAA